MKITLPSNRIESIDLLRGLVIVIMALDHIRDYFHGAAYLYDPTDLTQASPAIFFTRWITHFCAPVFVFLAGTSAYLIGLRKGKSELSSFLLKRGMWLILLELTIINFAWFFNVRFSFIALTVIWVLGLGMVALAGLVRLPFRWILIFSIALIAGHNALDGIGFSDMGPAKITWGLLHHQTFVSLGGDRGIFMGYGLLPWVAVMSLGYCFGKLYAPEYPAEQRRKKLIQLGIFGVAAFIVIRLINVYGDPNPWSSQPDPVYSFLSFMNVTKYPPSLLYLLMTLGPAMLFLAFTEQLRSGITNALTVIGRVPLFFYVVHIYVIHLVALVAALMTGFPASSMVFNAWITNSAGLRGYGFHLWVVYLIWVALIAALYPACKWFDAYKRAHKDKTWLSYC